MGTFLLPERISCTQCLFCCFPSCLRSIVIETLQRAVARWNSSEAISRALCLASSRGRAIPECCLLIKAGRSSQLVLTIEYVRANPELCVSGRRVFFHQRCFGVFTLEQEMQFEIRACCLVQAAFCFRFCSLSLCQELNLKNGERG